MGSANRLMIPDPYVTPGTWFYDDDIKNYINTYGAESLLKKIKISDIEKYLRKRKLEQLKKK